MDPKKATVYLEPSLHKALKMKAAESDKTVSDLVNEAIRHSLLEDAIDLDSIEERRNKPERSFSAFLNDLRKDGLL